jgi:UDP-glucose 4-epimerase
LPQFPYPDDVPPLVLIGARSRAGRAILAAWPGKQVVAVHRGDGDGVQVDDYAAVPPAVVPPDAFVVNCVGTPKGGEPELLRLNRDVALRWAQAAAQVGARHFVQLSSFAVYGWAERIDAGMPETPVNAYGRSKLAADRALADVGLPVTSLRIPMLFGDGPDKLTQLVAAVRKARVVPALKPPIKRSMLSYAALAAAVVELARHPVIGVVPVADPAAFTYERLADVLWEETGCRPLPLPIPGVISSLVRAAAAPLHARLLASSLLDPASAWRFPIPESASLTHALRCLARS